MFTLRRYKENTLILWLSQLVKALQDQHVTERTTEFEAREIQFFNMELENFRAQQDIIEAKAKMMHLVCREIFVTQ
jgi:hypothetical protein